MEELIATRRIHKREILNFLSGYYDVPFLEYDEALVLQADVIRMLDLEYLKKALWLPIAVRGSRDPHADLSYRHNVPGGRCVD